MAGNRHRGHVSIGGGALVLVCDFNALCEIEAHFDNDLEAGLQKIDAGKIILQDQRAVLAALLRHDTPRISMREAGDIIDQFPDEIGEGIRDAIALAMPEADPAKKPKRRKTARR